MAIFAKYGGVVGEAIEPDHNKWIAVASIDWSIRAAGSGGTQSRQRGTAVIEDLVLTFEYEKAAPKLQESLVLGQIIPKLEIEQTANYGGAPATFLRYELKDVVCTSFQVSAAGDDDAGPPIVMVGNSFREIEVTYTEYDGAGSKQGNVETSYRVETGKT